MESSFGAVHVGRRSEKSRVIPPRVQWGVYTAALILSDICLSLLAFAVAAQLRSAAVLPFLDAAKPSIPPAHEWLLFFVPAWVLVFAFLGLYDRRLLLGGMDEYAIALKSVGIGILVIILVGFVRSNAAARGWLILSWFFATVFVIGGRFILRHSVYSLRHRGYFLTPAFIVGRNAEAQSLAEQLLNWRTSGVEVLGFVGGNAAAPAPSLPQSGAASERTIPYLGPLESLDELVRRYGVEDLILATSDLSQEEVLAIFKQYGVRPDVNVRMSSGLFEIITTGMEVKEIGSVPLVQVNQVRLQGHDWYMKSALDLAVGAVLGLVSLPIFAILIPAIWLDSPGPVFYRRRVMGLNGTQFDAFKFRTMVVNGDEVLAAHPELQDELATTHKLKRDPRITRVGHFLRKSSLDELPQIINVFRREMSVVGPRMIAPSELPMYDKWDINLLTVPPGITGLWQVSGRSDVSYAERVHLDMRYIRNWSIWLDLHILIRTVGVVLKGKGAY